MLVTLVGQLQRARALLLQFNYIIPQKPNLYTISTAKKQFLPITSITKHKIQSGYLNILKENTKSKPNLAETIKHLNIAKKKQRQKCTWKLEFRRVDVEELAGVH